MVPYYALFLYNIAVQLRGSRRLLYSAWRLLSLLCVLRPDCYTGDPRMACAALSIYAKIDGTIALPWHVTEGAYRLSVNRRMRRFRVNMKKTFQPYFSNKSEPGLQSLECDILAWAFANNVRLVINMDERTGEVCNFADAAIDANPSQEPTWFSQGIDNIEYEYRNFCRWAKRFTLLKETL